MATASMNPAPNATKCSISRRLPGERRTTAMPPSRLPSAATRAKTSGETLDTGQEVVPRVARRILEHLVQQPCERRADVRPRSHPGGEEIVAVDGQLRQRQRILRGAHRVDDGRKRGARSGHAEQEQEIAGRVADLREPAAYGRQVRRIRVPVAPLADRAGPLDLLERALESRE